MKNILFSLCIIFTLIGVIHLQSTTQRSTQRTTPYRPIPIYCYRCSYLNCPRPFQRGGVSSYLSSNGWCSKTTSSSIDPNAPATRDIDAGYCANRQYPGCSWQTVQGVYTYLCCCNTDFCNAAISNSKLNYSILFLSFIIFLFKN